MAMRPTFLNAVVAWLFIIGSACFVVGSVPAYLNAVGGVADGVTFVIGSIFFTAASLGQLLQAQTPAMTTADPSQRETPARLQLWSWRPHDRNWVAAATQFPGTLFFNVSTTAALTHNMTAAEEDRRVWRPDLFGSTLFLVASAVAILAVSHGTRDDPRDPSAAADRLAEHARIHPLHGVRPGQLRTPPFRRCAQQPRGRCGHAAWRLVLPHRSDADVPGVDGLRDEGG